MRSSTLWTIATIFFHSVTLGLLIATLIGDSWAKIEVRQNSYVLHHKEVFKINSGVTGKYGLWEFCFTNTTICVRINHFYGKRNPDWFKAAQIAAATSCVFGLSAFFAALLKPCAKDCASVIAALNMFLAWICITGSLGVFAAKETTNDFDGVEKRLWGWTFIAGWTGSGMAFIASIVAWLAYSPKEEEPEVDMLFIQ